MSKQPRPVKLKPAEPQPEELPAGACQFSIGLFGPHPVPLTLECRPKSKRDLRDMIFAMVDEYYARCGRDGLVMHAGAPLVHIAIQSEPGQN